MDKDSAVVYVRISVVSPAVVTALGDRVPYVERSPGRACGADVL